MKYHLETLVIHRFRGLRELELADLGRINLFVGPNNSGKTSALEAISTFCRPLDPLEWLSTAWRREIKSSRTPQLDSLKWLFPQTSDSNPPICSARESKPPAKSLPCGKTNALPRAGRPPNPICPSQPSRHFPITSSKSR